MLYANSGPFLCTENNYAHIATIVSGASLIQYGKHVGISYWYNST